MSEIVKRGQPGPSGDKDRGRAFSCLHDMLAYHGRMTPDRKAILAPGGAAITYGALLHHVSHAVHELRHLGTGRGDRVAVVLPNGPETAVAMLAVAAGAVCVPLNPDFTASEWQRYFGDLRVTALVTRADMQSTSRGVANALGIPVIDLSPRPGEALGVFSFIGSPRPCSGGSEFADTSDDAFILPTSGTTSRPKMVPLTHTSICRSADNAGVALRLAPRDRLLNVLPLFHAHGLFSGLLAALTAGSSVVCMPGFDADAFFGWLTTFRPTWYTAVPAIHRAVLAAGRRQGQSPRACSLRLIRSASSSLPADVLGGLESLFGVPVVETYGMTEAASQIAANPLTRRKLNSVGQSAGAEIAIIDGEGRRLPSGERGEIVLRGPTLTRGYDNDAAANAEAFQDGWFRTGDLGYLDEDGYLFILGRLKEVINRGGQKVAPAEVEEALLSHSDVVEAAAFPIPHARLGEDVAAVVVLRRGARIGARRLQDFTRERLAGFKVPRLIRIAPEIPKGPAGKIRRLELAAMLSLTAPRPHGEPGDKLLLPRSGAERQLAGIWSDLLEIRQIGANQDVFSLGADSLTVTQMLSRLRKRFGIDLSFKDVLDAPTVAALALRLGSFERDLARPPRSLRDTPAGASSRLSYQQQRIHVLSRLDPTGHIYHIVEVARLSGSLDPGALESAIATICQRHEILRSSFAETAGEPMQRVGTASLRLERVDVGPCVAGRRIAAIQGQALDAMRRPFDLENELPLRARLVRFDEDDHALVMVFHHIVTDGWSQRLFWEEIAALYPVAANISSATLPELVVQYRQFAEWQRAWLQTPAAEAQRRYWRRQLEGLTELPLRTALPRPEHSMGRGVRHPLRLSRALSRRIKVLSRARRVTLFMTLLAAFQCFLHRYTGHDDIAVGSLIANRNQIDVERLMGMFANTIILRTDLSGDPTFGEVLRRVRQVTLDAFQNQDLPIEEILQDLQASRSADRQALFRTIFILQNGAPRALALPGLSTRFVDVDPETARADLLLELSDADGRLDGWFEYNTDLFDPTTMTRMARHFLRLLQAVVADPDEVVSRLDLMSERERRQILVDWNQARGDRARLGDFSRRFARQVKRTPDAVAVSAGPVRLGYRELARRSATIAERLEREGVGRDVVVILLAGRDVDFLASMIAVQQAGGAFLPLDPALPRARLTQIVRHSRAPLVLADPGCAASLEAAMSDMPGEERPKVLNLGQLVRVEPGNPVPEARAAPSSLAYVIYTSGSTGAPKGAMVERRGLINHLLSQITDFDLSDSDVIAQTAPQSFVLAVWQFLTPLMIGARVHIISDDEVQDPALLVSAIDREGVTVLQIVPALLRGILARVPDDPAFRTLSRLRVLACCGEALPPEVLRDWLRHFPNVPVVNAYGSTECSDDVASQRLVSAPASLDSVPIGRPIANTSLYVLDAHLQPLPIGVAGELYVGGIGVGRGYLNDPEQTRKRFLRDPFSDRRTARLYKTGDQARWRADGILEFLGRIDHQVKIRGNRVELTEIEHVLLEHPDVQAVTVLARDDMQGDARLVAHVVAAAGRQPDVRELRDFLKHKLPGYMVPAGFILLDHLPLTTRGKVDRRALAAIPQGPGVTGRGEAAAPRNSTEQVLVDIWADVLQIDGVGIFDDFFDLGGHSLLAGKLQLRVANAFGVRLPIKVFFETRTIAELSRRVDLARTASADGPTSTIARAEDDGSQPVSFVQQHVLAYEEALPGLPQFNMPFAYRLCGPLDIPALERSLAELMRRHESLRTAFARVNGQPVTVVSPVADVHVSLAVEDVARGAVIEDDRAKALLLKKAWLLAEQEGCTPFDITLAPLLRVRLLRLAADDHILVVVLHHIIVDGWSIGLINEELSEYYSAFTAGREARLPEPVPQFSGFVRWQRSWSVTAAATRQLSYWRQQVRGSSPMFLRADGRADDVLGLPVSSEPVDLPSDLVARLSELSRSRGVSLFMTLLTGFKTLLLARSGRNDICVATAMANRTHQRAEGVIGPLENTTLIRTRIDADLSFERALDRVRTSVLKAYARQDLPFNILAAKLAEDGLDPASLIQAFFAMRDAARRPLELPDLAVWAFGDPYRQGQSVLPIDRTWISVIIKQTPSGVTGLCSYKPDLFDVDVGQNWIADYGTILAKAAANSETSLGRLIDQAHGSTSRRSFVPFHPENGKPA